MLAEVSGEGNEFTATQFMSRELTGQAFNISNTYANVAHHNGSLDLSSYLLPGWTLYRVEINVENLTGIVEREVIGTAAETYEFKIWEYDSFNEYHYNSLTQGFYKQPHNGSLLNYSFYYESPVYAPALHG